MGSASLSRWSGPPDEGFEALARRLAGRFGTRVHRDERLGPRCTYRVGGPARLLVVVQDRAELDELAELLVPDRPAVLCLGRGSNLLVAEDGFDGVAIELGAEFARIVIDGTTVRAGAATLLPVLARRTAAASLGGFEWAVGVPGSVGGAVAMNAGGHGSDMAASLVSAEVVDLHRPGSRRLLDATELELGYRRSALRPSEVVTEVELRLVPGDRRRSEALIDEIVEWRRANQPGGQNAGSVFANPPGDSAGRLLDAAGVKGLRVRSAEVSIKHANFIQVDPSGSADDVYELMGELRRRVLAAGGPPLRPETRLVGFAAPLDGGVGGRPAMREGQC